MTHRIRTLHVPGTVGLFAALLLGQAAWHPCAFAQSLPQPIEVVQSGDHQALRDLIRSGADIDAPHGDGTTALHWAAHRGDAVAADLLLEAGAAPDAANDLGATPLWVAASSSSVAVVNRLLAAGADQNASLRLGETSVMVAARSGSVSVVESLLEHGANANAAELGRGQTALMWAAAQRHADVVRVLVAAGSDVHVRSKVWHQLENTAGNTNPSGNFRMAHGGSTPLLFAARTGDVDTARALVDAGADVNDIAAAGTSALVIAAHSGHSALAIYLVERGADPNAADAGYTALHAAILRSDVALVRALLRHGANPDAVVEHGTPGRRFGADYSIRHQAVGANAFWLASMYGELEILRVLAEHGADPLVTPATGASSLQAALGVPMMARENRRNRVGAPPTDTADEERRSLEIVRLVLDRGVDVNASDARGNTALHDAVRRRFTSVVEFLAENGADLDAGNKDGSTPLMLAESQQPLYGTNGLSGTRGDMADLLRRLGASEPQ